MGGVFFDHTLEGYLNIRQGGSVGGAGYTFDSAYTMTGGRLGYRTNGNEVFLDDITMNVEALGVTLDVVGDTLALDAPRVVGNWEVGAIRYSNNPLNHGVSVDSGSGQLLPSYGSLSGSYDLSSSTGITAGGRSGKAFASITRRLFTRRPFSIWTTVRLWPSETSPEAIESTTSGLM